MDRRGRTPLDRYEDYRRQTGGTDEAYMEHCVRESYKIRPYLTMKILVQIYAIDQTIGKRIHDAYREAVLAANNGAENFDELIAEIESKETQVTESENQLQLDDDRVELFKQEVKETVASMMSLLLKNEGVGRRIHDASSHVILRTYHDVRFPTSALDALDLDQMGLYYRGN